MAVALEWSAPYELASDLIVVPRDHDTVQIGTDEPRRALITGAPAGTEVFLTTLAHAPSLAEAIAAAPGDAQRWRLLCTELAQSGLLVRATAVSTHAAHVAGERLMLTHQFGADGAQRALTARSDALVIVEGDTPVADTVTDLLVALGVGHVHQRSSVLDRDDPADRPAKRSPGHTDVAWQPYTQARLHRPAPQIKPAIVVFTGEPLPDVGRAAELVTRMVPHLAVQVFPARAVVGPLVLPGVTACLNCLDRHRTEADPSWPTVAAALATHPRPESMLLAHTAAGLAAGQVVEWIDGVTQPESVGATLERFAGDVRPQRRTWAAHGDCRCQRVMA